MKGGNSVPLAFTVNKTGMLSFSSPCTTLYTVFDPLWANTESPFGTRKKTLSSKLKILDGSISSKSNFVKYSFTSLNQLFKASSE